MTYPMQSPPRDLTPEEATELADRAYALHTAIVGDVRTGNMVAWSLAEKLYAWDETRGWLRLGGDYRTLGDWLADPEIGMTRSGYFRLVGLWRDLVVRRQVKAADLAELEPLKVDTVMAAVRDHRVDLDEALEDARSMGHRDLRETYRAPARQSPDVGTDENPDGDGDQVARSGLSVGDLNRVSRGEVLDAEDGELAQNGDGAIVGKSPEYEEDEEETVRVPAWVVDRLIAMEGSKRIPVDVLAALKDARAAA